MKEKFYESNYALNRNKKAIIYKNNDGTILEITLEKNSCRKSKFHRRRLCKVKGIFRSSLSGRTKG